MERGLSLLFSLIRGRALARHFEARQSIASMVSRNPNRVLAPQTGTVFPTSYLSCPDYRLKALFSDRPPYLGYAVPYLGYAVPYLGYGIALFGLRACPIWVTESPYLGYGIALFGLQILCWIFPQPFDIK
jgi:hypothetical protein